MFYKIGVHILSKKSVILSVFNQLYKGFVETLSRMSKLILSWKKKIPESSLPAY